MTSPENDFDDLRKLLRCKQYEQPPPGYFLSFSDKVLTRIELEDRASEHSSWWSWFVARFDAKPVLVCAYGLAMSSLLFVGIRVSQLLEAEAAIGPVGSGPWMAFAPGSPLLEGSDFSQTINDLSPFAGVTTSRIAYRDDAQHLRLTRGNLQLQTAGFSLSAP